MKLLFFVIMRNDEHRNRVLAAMNKYEATGTVIPTSSIRNAILNASTEPLPIFGALRQLSEHSRDLNTTIMTVIEEKDLEATKMLVRSLSVEGTENDGIMFAIPVVDFEEFTN